jgi:hypothetical protein
MSRNWVPGVFGALVVALLAAIPRPAAAEFFGCADQHRARPVSYSQAVPYALHYARAGEAQNSYAQVRPRVTIHPRHQARRICRSWLAKEYRVAGPVIVPRMSCHWE